MRLRWRLRTLMVAVAVAALLLGGIVWGAKLRRLARVYRIRAYEHAREERRLNAWASPMLARYRAHQRRVREEEWPEDPQERPMAFLRDWALNGVKLAEHHGALRRKYERLAAHPWLPVEPDPPPPR